MNLLSHNQEPPPAVLSAFGFTGSPVIWQPVPCSGFSGARLWSAGIGGQRWIVRRFPSGVTGERLAEIARVLRHVAAAGCDFVPVPLVARDGFACVALHGELWQIEPLLAGTADFCRYPSAHRLRAALQALARWHVAASSLTESLPPAAAAGILRRRERLAVFAGGQARQMAGQLAWSGTSGPFRDQLEPLLLACVQVCEQHEIDLQRQLNWACQLRVPRQYCIRDIWHDHVLFSGEQVSGIVDFDAVRVDAVAADISRLLGSLLGGVAADWQPGLAAYQSVRPLSEAERRLVPIYDQANALLSGLQWLEWIAVEGRHFDWPRVVQRLQGIRARFVQVF